MAQPNIVPSLFGITPELYQQNRLADLQAQQVRAGTMAAGPGTMLNPSLAPLYAQAAQQGQLIGEGARAVAGLLGVEDPELQKIRDVQQMRSQFDVSTPAGLRQFAQALGQRGYADLAMQASAEADKRDLTQAQTVRALREPGMQSFEKLVSSGKYTPASLAKYQQSGNVGELVLTKEAAAGEGGIGKLTPAQKAADMAFGKEYNDFVAGGAVATIQKNLKDLDNAIATLEKSKDGEITGKLIGLSDKAGTLSYTNPKAAEIKDIVGGVVQSNLRAVLGGQFAQKEGEALLARAFNSAQPQKDNLNRLKALREQITNAANAKIQAVSEFEEKGTLKDFKPGAFRQSAESVTKPSGSKAKKTITLKSGKTVEVEED
jgi:hypothetical protein